MLFEYCGNELFSFNNKYVSADYVSMMNIPPYFLDVIYMTMYWLVYFITL